MCFQACQYWPLLPERTRMDRREFSKRSSVTIALGAVAPLSAVRAGPAPAIQAGLVKPVVIGDWSGYNYRNGGKEKAVERAFRPITEGKDVLDVLIEGV